MAPSANRGLRTPITAGVGAGEGAEVGASPRIPTPETICNATSLGKSLARMGGRSEHGRRDGAPND